MNNNHILLSISMLISGRDEMEKSLNSLLYFKNAFPTEIILVDTGCNAEQRALAEKYADKIINFTWCDDFAAARNAGLKEAQGEWFMYLDDDEWFDNPKEIISFFSTGEYRMYNSASYVVRNYLDAEGVGYVDSYPSRMVKKEINTIFIGKVHEYIEPFRRPKKVFKDYVHHYGYVYADNEAMQRHMSRNTAPLLKMREECPGDPRWMFQLAQEYFSVDEYSKAIEVCKKGLSEWNELKETISYYPVHVGVLYAYILMGLERLQRYEEEKEWLNVALNSPLMKMDMMELCLTFYYLEGARLHAYFNDDKKCCEYFRKYIYNANKISGDRERMENESAGIVTSVFNNQLLSETIMICLKSAILNKEDQLAEKAFTMIDWKERRYFFRRINAKKIVDACCNEEFRNFFETILEKLTDKDQGIHEMYPIFLELQKEYKDKKEGKKIWNLRQLVSKVKSNHFYVIGTKIIWQEEKTKNKAVTESSFHKLFTQCQDHILEVEDDVWEVAEKEKIEIEELFLQINYRVWRRELERMEHWGTSDDWKKWNDRISVWKQKEDIRYDLFEIKYKEIDLTEEIKECDGLSKLEESLWLYADKVINFYKPYYKEEVLLENSVGLPDELQLALELKKQKEYCESGQNQKALEHLKNCLGIYPKLEKVMLAYAEMVRDRMQQQITEAKEAQEELQQMVISLKNIAKQKLESGEIVAAKAILSQVQQYAPDDDEIKTLLHNLEEEVQ